jgi:hypothetical protein
MRRNGSSSRLIRILVLLAVAVAIFAATRLISKRSEPVSSRVSASYQFLIPDLCRMQTELVEDERTQAYNSFYRRAHPALHRLVGELKTGNGSDRALSSELQLAKTKVETGVITFPTTMSYDVARLITASGQGLTRIKSDSQTECESEQSD